MPGSSVHGISEAILESVAPPSSGDLIKPRIKPTSPALAGRFFTAEPQKPLHRPLHFNKYNKYNREENIKKKNTIIQSVFTGNVYGLNSFCWVPPTNSWQTSMTPSLTHQIVLHYSIWFCMDYFTEHIYKGQFLCTSANFLLFCVSVSLFILFLLLIIL